MSATAARPNFAFIAASYAGKPADVDRKLIRSHCMKGKNKKRRAQVATPNLPRASYSPQPATLNLLSPLSGCVQPIPGSIRRSPPRHGREADKQEQCLLSLAQGTEEELVHLEPPPPDLSLVNFAAEVNGQSRALLFKCLPPSSPPWPLRSMADGTPRLYQSKSNCIPCGFLR